MGNGRKQTALWLVFVEGAALSLGIYLLLTVLLSALVVKAVLPEEGSFPAVAASCCLASFAGAMLSVLIKDRRNKLQAKIQVFF